MNRSEGASMKECEFYDDNHCMLAPQNKCSEIHIDYCYYKQLTQAKEENERLNKANNDLINDTAKAIGNYDKLQHDLKVAREGINNYIEHSEKWICVKNCKQKCHSDCSVIKFKKVLSEISDKDTTDIQEEVGYSKADVFDEYFG